MSKKKQEINNRRAALDYHQFPHPGKLEIRATKPLANQIDLARAYSPGVAEACLKIKNDASRVSLYTSRANLVGVVSNGSAVLGLGNIGPLASKPVMEGKAVLFKKFANIDCFDIEINESDPLKLAELIVRLEPTFGAINLEDIKAPECFVVEEYCVKHMNIPVFHDDQHGTAIVVAAAVLNALDLAGKRFSDIKIVALGAGAAGIACLNMLVELGARRKNIWLLDRVGLVTLQRCSHFDAQKAAYAQDSILQTLDHVIDGADMFLGLSAANLLTGSQVKRMNKTPIIFALANPVPEIMPDVVHAAVSDAIIATGRSDFPNQVNNVLCFPFIFRGALDVGATMINKAMKIACVRAIAALARQASDADSADAYVSEDLTFGANYVIPKAFDSRLLSMVAPAVAQAAMDSGVATNPLDIVAYKAHLEATTNKSALIMRPVFETARRSERRIVFAEGEDMRILRAAYTMLEETKHTPILIGRPLVIKMRCDKLGLPIDSAVDFEVVNPEKDDRFYQYWNSYHKLRQRQGVTPDISRTIMRTNTTAIAAIMVHRGEADTMICGAYGQYRWHLRYVSEILQTDTFKPSGALSLNIMESGPIFVADTHVHSEPTAEQIATTVIAAARHVRRFGITPRIALCSNSQFGNLDSRSGLLMRKVCFLLDHKKLDFTYEGEMHVDAALDADLQLRLFPDSRMQDAANVLIFSNTDAAGAVRNILHKVANGLEIGPILMGMGNRAHILTASARARDFLNTSALAGSALSSYK